MPTSGPINSLQATHCVKTSGEFAAGFFIEEDWLEAVGVVSF
jgi:hypothetical protein